MNGSGTRFTAAWPVETHHQFVVGVHLLEKKEEQIANTLSVCRYNRYVTQRFFEPGPIEASLCETAEQHAA